MKEEAIARVYSAAEKNHVKFMIAQALRFWPEYELIYAEKVHSRLIFYGESAGFFYVRRGDTT